MPWVERASYLERLRSVEGTGVYIQVSDNVDAPETLERELAPLRAIRDAYPKVLIARTRHDDYTIDGIRVLDLARWLIGEQGF